MTRINSKFLQGSIFIYSFTIPPFKIDQWSPLKVVISLIISPFAMALTQDPKTIFT